MKYHVLISNWPLKYLLLAIVAIKIFGIFFAVHIFAKYTPLVDSNLYLQDGMKFDLAMRTRLINDMAVYFNNVGGAYFAHFLFSLFSTAGLLYYYVTGGRRWILLIFLLLPSSLVWTSIVGKEAIYFGATGVAIVIWSKYAVEKITSYDFIFLAIAMFVCAMFRPHYALALGWLFFSTYILKNFGQNSSKILMASLLLLAFCVYFFSWEALLLRGFGGIDPSARSSRFDLLGINHSTDEGYLKYKSMILIGLIWGIIGPTPSEISQRFEFLPFFVEGIFILLMPILGVVLASRIKIGYKNYFYRVFFFSLVPAIVILLFIHAPFGVLNPGSAIRWRVNFEQMFYLAPMLLIFRFMDVITKENSSFSS